MTRLTKSPQWQALLSNCGEMTSCKMQKMFDNDLERFNRFSIKLDDILVDYSKNIITDKTLRLLFGLARSTGLEQAIQSMFTAKKINCTEQRAALHIALRNMGGRPILLDGQDVMPQIAVELKNMRGFVEAVRQGSWLGIDRQAITDVVNIGIGGSDLGPHMVTEALRPFAGQLRVHFVSNVDATQLLNTLQALNYRTTLFVVVSKTFTTQETLMNACSARSWFLQQGGTQAAIASHFVAVSTHTEAVVEFGINPVNMFQFWNWVGGRYSLWSTVGLSIALSVGMDRFEQLLAGAHVMDEHFRTTPFEQNIPVILAMLGIWYNNFFGAGSYAILPYDQNMHRFPAYLQQADMESNGKSIDRQGRKVDYSTGAVIWGEPGTNGQHAFYQLLHQGTRMVPVDFLLPARSLNPLGDHHQTLIANCLAQSEALMLGKTATVAAQELAALNFSPEQQKMLLPHKLFPGNRPSNTILFDELNPVTLGKLIAMYEHKIYVQSVVWNINAFDQWGVELGKQLAKPIVTELSGKTGKLAHDASTSGLIKYCQTLQTRH